MKKHKKQGVQSVFCLPNHHWRDADQVAPELKKTPGCVVRDCGSAVLVRDYPKVSFERDWVPMTRDHAPNTESSPLKIFCEADYMVQLLEWKATSGNSNAAMELARIATQATVALTRIARETPGLLLRYSRLRHGWPVIKMKRERLSAEERALFAGIQLGEDALIELDAQSAKWILDDAARVAYELLNHIERARTGAPHWNYGTVRILAKKLRPFSDETAPDWWDLAKGILLSSYPEPERVAELNSLVTAKSKRRSPGRIRQAILDMLQSRFLSFARNTYRT